MPGIVGRTGGGRRRNCDPPAIPQELRGITTRCTVELQHLPTRNLALLRPITGMSRISGHGRKRLTPRTPHPWKVDIHVRWIVLDIHDRVPALSRRGARTACRAFVRSASTGGVLVGTAGGAIRMPARVAIGSGVC